MLKFFQRRKPQSIDLGDQPLEIRNLLDHPALREVMAPLDENAPVSLAWNRLIAAGPIRFDRPLDRAAA